jgi:broad specificity phosphatase PhoE
VPHCRARRTRRSELPLTLKHTELFLIRHGQTDSNVNGLFHGATDVPLNSMGRRQASLVARRVGDITALAALHSSPLQRARHTAEAISRHTRLAPRFHQGLREIDFGEAEGLTLPELHEQYAELMQRFGDPSDLTVQFPGGESRHGFHRRVRETLDRIATRHRGERVVVVAHGGVISSGIAQIIGDDPTDWRRYHVENCSVTHIELASSGPIVHVVSDVVHLEELHVVAAPKN